MTVSPQPRLAWPDENGPSAAGQPAELPPPEFATVVAQLPRLGHTATKEIAAATERAGHELAALKQCRHRAQADLTKAEQARSERQAVHARADAADRAIGGAPHGNRRGRIPTTAYVLLMGVLLALNIPLDMTGLFGLQLPLVYTLLLAVVSGLFILGAGHLIGHHLKRRSQCVAPEVQLRAGERWLALALGIAVIAGILVLATLRALSTGLLGGLFVLAVLGGEFGIAILLAYHHQHDGERDRRRADRSRDRSAKAHRVSVRGEESQLQRFLAARTGVAAVAARWVARFDVLETVAVNAWRTNHPDGGDVPRMPVPAWLVYARALAAGAIPTQLLLPDERGEEQPPADGDAS
jgi:hypothetical protein